jgi:hypothetical protein
MAVFLRVEEMKGNKNVLMLMNANFKRWIVSAVGSLDLLLDCDGDDVGLLWNKIKYLL